MTKNIKNFISDCHGDEVLEEYGDLLCGSCNRICKKIPVSLKNFIEETKEWFEANYLDGDKIQGGQMLSSEECLDAVSSRQISLIKMIVEMVESESRKDFMGAIPQTDEYANGWNDCRKQAYQRRNEVLDTITSNLKELIK